MPLYALLQTASDEVARLHDRQQHHHAAAMVLSTVLTMALVAAGVSVPGLFLLAGLASLPVAALFWRLAPGFSLAPAPTALEAEET